MKQLIRYSFVVSLLSVLGMSSVCAHNGTHALGSVDTIFHALTSSTHIVPAVIAALLVWVALLIVKACLSQTISLRTFLPETFLSQKNTDHGKPKSGKNKS